MNTDNDLKESKKKFFDKLPNDISMITSVWGPPTWFFLHSMAMAYPKKININNPEHKKMKNSMFAFLSILTSLLSAFFINSAIFSRAVAILAMCMLSSIYYLLKFFKLIF